MPSGEGHGDGGPCGTRGAIGSMGHALMRGLHERFLPATQPGAFFDSETCPAASPWPCVPGNALGYVAASRHVVSRPAEPPAQPGPEHGVDGT